MAKRKNKSAADVAQEALKKIAAQNDQPKVDETELETPLAIPEPEVPNTDPVPTPDEKELHKMDDDGAAQDVIAVPEPELPATDVVPVDATVREPMPTEQVESESVTWEELEAAGEILDEAIEKELPAPTKEEMEAVREVIAAHPEEFGMAKIPEPAAFTLTSPTDKQTYSEAVNDKAVTVQIGDGKPETTAIFVGNNLAESHTLQNQPTAAQPTDGKVTNAKYLLNGKSSSAILRFMGNNGITASQAKRILTKLGMHPMPAQATISTQIQRGRAGESILPLGEELESHIMDIHLELQGAGSKVVIDIGTQEAPIDDKSGITVVAGTPETKA